MKALLLAIVLLASCKPAMFHVDNIECPIEVPPDIVAAYLGCTYDAAKKKTTCPKAAFPAPLSLTIEACDMVPCDGGVP